MKKKLQNTMAAIALTAMTQATFAAETSRTLVPLADPLDQIQGNIKQARERAAKDLEKARKALIVAKFGLVEMLVKLANDLPEYLAHRHFRPPFPGDCLEILRAQAS